MNFLIIAGSLIAFLTVTSYLARLRTEIVHENLKIVYRPDCLGTRVRVMGRLKKGDRFDVLFDGTMFEKYIQKHAIEVNKHHALSDYARYLAKFNKENL